MSPEKKCIFNGERLISAISDAVQGTNYLKQMLPIGVIIGSCLAALRKHFHVVTTHESEDFDVKDASSAEVDDLGPSVSLPEKCSDKDSNNNGKAVVGVVVTALGTSAFFTQQLVSNSGDDSVKTLFQSSTGGVTTLKEPVKLDEASSEKEPSNITSLESGPTLNGSPKFAELACIVGVYITLIILIMLWGKRIRGHEKPLQQYGLNLTCPDQIQDFLKGFVVGVMLVYSVQYANSLLGFVGFSQPCSLYPPSLDSIALLKVFGEVVLSVSRATATATSVAIVEELLFRSWLLEKNTADHGYHQELFGQDLHILFSREFRDTCMFLNNRVKDAFDLKKTFQEALYLAEAVGAGVVSSLQRFVKTVLRG